MYNALMLGILSDSVANVWMPIKKWIYIWPKEHLIILTENYTIA